MVVIPLMSEKMPEFDCPILDNLMSVENTIRASMNGQVIKVASCNVFHKDVFTALLQF